MILSSEYVENSALTIFTATTNTAMPAISKHRLFWRTVELFRKPQKIFQDFFVFYCDKCMIFFV